MKANRNNFDLEGIVNITEFIAWMDGGTIELKCEDQSSVAFIIEMTQPPLPRESFRVALCKNNLSKYFFFISFT